MKKFILSVSSLLFSLSVLAQIPNPSFENWDTINGTCNGWFSLNDFVGATNTTRETISTDGNYSVGLQSITIPGFGIAPGLATTGSLNMTTFSIEGGYATNERPDSLVGYVQESNLVGDSSSALVIVTHHGTTSQEIGRGGIYFKGNSAGFRRFSFPITYTSSASTDTILIILTAGGLSSTVDGSKIWIDDLHYTFPLGIRDIQTNKQDIQVLQTATSIELLNLSSNSSVQLLDMHGQIVKSNHALINTSDLSSGMYFLLVSDPAYSTFSRKIIVQN